MTAASLLPLVVFVPLLGTVFTALVRGRARPAIGIAMAVLTAAAGGAVWASVAAGDTVELALAGWEAPLGITLRADGPSVLMLALACVVVLAASVVGATNDTLVGGRAFWPLVAGCFAAVNGVFVAGDLFTLYVLLELLTVTAVSLVALGGRKAAAPALRYLFVAVAGSLLFLLAVALVYAEAGTLDLVLVAERMEPGVVLGAVLVLTTVGMAAKTALFPLHSWLPVAHPAAPAAVSALLSALVIKGSLFVLWRVASLLGPLSDLTPVLATVVGVAGSIAVLWGGTMALRRNQLKTMIAYSTVAQVGYLALILPLMQLGAGEAAAETGWSGGILLAVAHGLAKAAMFLAAGALVAGYGTDRLDRLEGAVTRMPVAVATIGIAGISLAGLPPTLGFVAKWQLLQASLAQGAWWWIVVLLAGGLLTFAYTGKMIRATFNPPGEANAEPPAGTPRRLVSLVPFALAVASVVLGVFPAALAGILSGTLPMGGMG